MDRVLGGRDTEEGDLDTILDRLLREQLARCTPGEWASLLMAVCRGFAARYGAAGASLPDLGVAPNQPGCGEPPWLGDDRLFDDPERWAWSLAGLTTAGDVRRMGAVNTGRMLACYMCSRAMDEWEAGGRPPGRSFPRVIDPAAGAGAFLIAMASEMERRYAGDPARGESPRALAMRLAVGVDVDPVSVVTARAATWLYSLGDGRCGEPAAARVYAGDSLLEPAEWWSSGPGARGTFDILIANPPYVRQELLGRERKAAFASAYPGFGGRCDLYVYFFALAASLLGEGGVAAIVCPVSWLDVGYGERVKRFVLEHFDITDIIGPGDARWFPGASVNAQVVLMRKAASGGAGGGGADGGRRTRFQVVAGAAGGRLSVVLSRSVEKARLDPSRKWGAYLRAPDPYFALLEAAGGGLCRLGDLAEVSFGVKTGANEFFYLRDVSNTPAGAQLIRSLPDGGADRVRAVQPACGRARGRVFPIESDCLTPVVKSLRDVRGYRVNTAELEVRALTTVRGDGGIPPHAMEYVKRGEALGYSSRPTCRSRKPWHRLAAPPAAILYAMSWGSRMGAPLCDAGAMFDARLYGIQPRAGVDVLALAAALNVTATWLFTEVSGRPMTGSLPLLDIKIYEVEGLPVLDLRRLDGPSLERLGRAMAHLLERPLLDIREEVRLEDRRELDELALALAGCSPSRASRLARSTAEALVGMVETRLMRSGRVLG